MVIGLHAELGRGMAMNDGGKDSPNKSKNLFDNFKGQAGKRKTYLKQSKEHVNKRALAMKGVARPPNNAKAKEWAFVNKAKGYVLEGKNLRQLIRDNPHMFDGEKIKTIASGLQKLTTGTRKTKPHNFWKGWVLKL